MRITCITPATPYKYVKKDYSTRTVSNNQTFRAGLWSRGFYKEPWTKLKNVTIEEYKQLSLLERHSIRRLIRRVYGTSLDEDLKFNYIAASGIKKTLDEIYGENNYVVITIGRSLSSLGKGLGYKIGEDNVKQIPMSSASRFLELENCQNENFDIFKKYLSSIGLSKRDIKTSGKQYIITDYCCTGKSLAGAEELLISDYIWGEQPNVSSINVSRLIGNIEPNTIFPDFKIDNRDFLSALDDMFASNTLKKYSLVLKCRKLADTPDSIISPECDNKKTSFFFKFLDLEMRNK